MIGTCETANLRELNRWRRLIEGEGVSDIDVWLVQPSWPPPRRRLVSALFPPSTQSDIRFVVDRDQRLREIVAGGVFALVRETDIARILVAGPATESNWEPFEPFLSRLDP